LLVGQNIVSFVDLLEFFLGGFVAGVFVWVVFDRKLAIGFFDFVIRGVFADA